MTSNIRLEERDVRVIADGMAFGEVGPYERLRGVVHYQVDPSEPAQAGIVDLDKAPVNSHGRVEFQGDFLLLRPVEPDRGNRRILFEYCNRGNLRAMQFFNDGQASNDPIDETASGNGFLMRQGYVMAWCAWQGDLWPGDGRLTLTVPEATEDGEPIHGIVRTEFIVDEPGCLSIPLSGHASTRSYPAVDRNTHSAQFSRRRYPEDQRQMIAPSEWSFARIEAGSHSSEHRSGRAVVPSNTHVYLPAGFDTGWLYELVYTAQNPLVLGLGHVAVRDFVGHLKYGQEDCAGHPNPAGPGIEKAYCWGRSQAGRVIRELVYAGFNEDRNQRRVFDGVLPHVSGGGLMWMNHRFACVTSTAGQQYEEHENVADRFPFSYARSVDHLSGKEDAILKRPETDPLVIHTQTATEYWQRHGSLVHTDTKGNDLLQPDTVRIYLWSSSQHFADPNLAVPVRGVCKQYNNIVRTTMLFRAALVAMDRWVTDGLEPPASQVPNVKDGSLIEFDSWQSQFPDIPGVLAPLGPNRLAPYDFGPDASAGLLTLQPPVRNSGDYTILVPAVDQDGNEIAGVRAPMVQAPLGTYTGWNLRDRGHGEGYMHEFTGSTIPLPQSEEVRRATRDPRPSVQSRYPDRESYLEALRTAAEKLVQDGLMLEEDVGRSIAESRNWHWLMKVSGF
tara:strand:- start:29 stop:2044 length:2016 start_codon:yes stop_codon:yes gene_type:complete